VSEQRKWFPIQWQRYNARAPGVRSRIPWEVIAPHEQQANRNHGGQTLARLAERGGLSPAEAISVIEDHEFSPLSDDAADDRLEELVAEFEIAKRNGGQPQKLRLPEGWRWACFCACHCQKLPSERTLDERIACGCKKRLRTVLEQPGGILERLVDLVWVASLLKNAGIADRAKALYDLLDEG
jgi:hypothetical protein